MSETFYAPFWGRARLDKVYWIAVFYACSGFRLGIFPCPAVPAQPHDAEQSLAEYSAAHLRRAFATVDKDYRHLFYLEADFIRRVFHLYLEGVAFETYLVEFHRREHSATVAFKARRGVVNLETGDQPHVF